MEPATPKNDLRLLAWAPFAIALAVSIGLFFVYVPV